MLEPGVQKNSKKKNLDQNLVQINNSLTIKKGTIRGMHFQYPPKAETKLVRCINGAVWDVIVDLRKDSTTFGQWYAVELNKENRTMMYVPKGFAHGFQSLKENSELIYLHSEFYDIRFEGSVKYNDPDLKINWPLRKKIVSEKDSKNSLLREISPIVL